MSVEIKKEMLTAYVLDELEPSERDEIAKRIEKDPELKEQIAELEEFCSFMGDEMSKEPKEDLTGEQIKALKGQFEKSSKSKKKTWSFNWKIWVPAVAASCAAVVALLLIPMTMMMGSSKEYTSYEMELPAPKDPHLVNLTHRVQEEMDAMDAKETISMKTQLQALGYIHGGEINGKFGTVAVDEGGGFAADYEKTRFKGDGWQHNTETYDNIVENEFLSPKDKPLSTFSIDVDTASYANVRRYLNDGQLPPKGAVRIEELINYFSYNYEQPTEGPFSANVEIAQAPWKREHRLVQIGLKGREIPFENAPNSNLVFLIDTSGSMDSPNKIQLLKKSMRLLVENLGGMDRVAIVVYAGSAGLVLPSTTADQKGKILGALDKLNAGGSTNGGEGIKLAYKIAKQNFIPGGTNRVILATDGDFNVGTTNQGGLVRLIEEKKKSGIFLTVLGFGMGNYKDSTLEKIADKGNGNYAYIDTLNEAKKVLVHEIGQTLVTIAKDVKIQIEFNPAEVQAYRLIGYENRVLQDKDFNDDKKDAGEIGAGHTVTALYEIVPVGINMDTGKVDKLRYQEVKGDTPKASSGELCTLKLRYKEPSEHKSKLMDFIVRDYGDSLDSASSDFKHAAAVASFGMLLRDSKFKGNSTYNNVLSLARSGQTPDPHGYRQEFITLVKKASSLSRNN